MARKRQPPKKRRARRADTSASLLRDAMAWFERATEYGPESASYLNGDSVLFPGNGWAHAVRLRNRIKRHLIKGDR